MWLKCVATFFSYLIILKRENCYDQTSDSEPNCLDSNRYSPDAFVHARGISCSRILRGRKCDFAVRTVVVRVPCHSSSRFWHVGRCIVRRNVSCPAALRHDMFMGVSWFKQRSALLTHRNLTSFEIHISSQINTHTHTHTHIHMHNASEQIKWEAHVRRY